MNHARYLKVAACVAVAIGCAAQNEDDGDGSTPSKHPSSAGSASAGSTSLSVGGTASSAGTASGGNAAGTTSTNGSGGTPRAGTAATGGTSSGAGNSSVAGGGTAAGGTGAGGFGVGGTAAGGAPACPAAPVALGTMPLIDDFNHLGRNIPSVENRSGVWDVWTLSAAAEMSPKSANYATTGADSGNGYTHWTGTNIGGANDWGPTLTVQLSAGCPYDASAYTGIAFKLKGTATKTGSVAVPLKVMFWQPPAVPAKDAKGGTCVAAACYNHFSAFVDVPASWDTPVTLPFASLTQGVWTGTVPFAFSAKQLLAIQFQVEVDGSKSELATFDLSLDDLMFVK
ncbi:MAG TPA: hypothetical protein VHB79_07730 [Polyangiaceae bacterium]|nr:hypothetical protein [Polyangiaceae bacterium]